jgi:hypothetical protein
MNATMNIATRLMAMLIESIQLVRGCSTIACSFPVAPESRRPGL